MGEGKESAAEMGMFQEQWEIPQCGVQGASVGGQIQITEPEVQTAQPGFWKKKESKNLKTCQS